MPEEKRITASAKATITLEISLGGGTWPEAWDFQDIYKEVLGKARKQVAELLANRPGVQLTGDIQFDITIFEEKDA